MGEKGSSRRKGENQWTGTVGEEVPPSLTFDRGQGAEVSEDSHVVGWRLGSGGGGVTALTAAEDGKMSHLR